MQTIESLRRVILRIANYIYKCKNEYQIANVDLNHVAKFIKIRKLFVWDDIEAISTLSMLCQKKGMNSFFEYNCKIVFQQSGCHKEIGVTSNTTTNYSPARRAEHFEEEVLRIRLQLY
jgi:hypothetical protein